MEDFRNRIRRRIVSVEEKDGSGGRDEKIGVK